MTLLLYNALADCNFFVCLDILICVDRGDPIRAYTMIVNNTNLLASMKSHGVVPLQTICYKKWLRVHKYDHQCFCHLSYRIRSRQLILTSAATKLTTDKFGMWYIEKKQSLIHHSSLFVGLFSNMILQLSKGYHIHHSGYRAIGKPDIIIQCVHQCGN